MTDFVKGRGFARRASALALALAALALGAAPAGAARLDPVSHDFGAQAISTPSAPKAFSLTAGCDVALGGACLAPEMFGTGIALGGTEFSQTNDCPPTLVGSVAGTSCTIVVTFTPNALGPRQDILRTGVGGPQASLTGEGVLPPSKRRCKSKKKRKKPAAAAKKKCKKKGKPHPVIENPSS